VPGIPLSAESATIYAALLAIVGSVIGGFIGAWATLRAMREQVGAADKARAEAQEAERLAALRALLRELEINLTVAESPQADRAWVPFEQAALAMAQPHLLTLPDDTHSAIQQARLALSRYNTLAYALNHEPLPSALPDDGSPTGGYFAETLNRVRRGDSDREAARLADVAKGPLHAALDALRATLAREAP
jgi:hypothetical protein